MERRSVVAVPARLRSSRLPNKVLADIGGRPMIQRVLERCRAAVGPEAVVLCTDTATASFAELGFPRADDRRALQFRQRADRLGCAAVDGTRLGGRGPDPLRTAVINVQGDQPFLDPAVVTAMTERLLAWICSGSGDSVYRLKPDSFTTQCRQDPAGPMGAPCISPAPPSPRRGCGSV